MDKTQRIFNILSILVIISMMAAPVLAQPVPASSTGIDSEISPQSLPTNPADDAQAEQLLPPADQPSGNSKFQFEQVEAEVDVGEAIYFVQLTAPSAVLYDDNVEGYTLSRANTEAGMRDSDGKFNAASLAAVDYMDYLESTQKTAMSDVDQELGRSVEVTYQYKATMNGFAALMTAAEAAQVAKMDGVKYVNKGLDYELHTDYGPDWLGAKGIWDGSATGGLPGTMGEGVVVGVIDTGIDPWNPSFLVQGGDSYTHTNPKPKYYGVCDPTNISPPIGTTPYSATLAAACNDKLIGMWGYTSVNGGDPRDVRGHGSHCASTAAGNFVYNATITTSTVFTADISGVAPHANIIAYAACCTGFDLAAAREQVVLDGVDVVNYSIGSPNDSDPLSFSSQQWLAIREAGIFVATSAGNSGPGPETLGHPADLPWLTSVGANSHDRTFLNSLTVNDGVNGPLTLDGQSITDNLITPTLVVFSSVYTASGTISDDDARLCADDVFSGTVDFGGAIVVCERGTYGRVAKGQTVADANAGGYILAQPAEFGGGPGSLASDFHVLPAVHIDYYEYQNLLTYTAAATQPVMGTIAGSTMVVGDQYGNIMASTSSRGPSRMAGDGMASHIVPSVTAPGRGIWAAHRQGDTDGEYTFNVIQGTSMSSPHVAGAGALLTALHPTWTPSQIESALMLTARSPITDDNGLNLAKPFTAGAGHVDLLVAGQTGLLLSVATGEYSSTLPSEGGDPTELNRAALGNEQCLGDCSWQRTFTSAITSTVVWTASVMSAPGLTVTVDPPTFTIPAGGTQVVTVTADVSALPMDVWEFGKVMWDSGGQAPGVHMPLAVKPIFGIIPDQVDITTRRNAGSVLVEDFKTLEVTDLTINNYGLEAGTLDTRSLVQDPTNDTQAGEQYDGGAGVFYVTTTVVAGDVMLIAEILASEAPAIDLFVGSGATPSLATELCHSTIGFRTASCDIRGSALTPGTYWILVQNQFGSASQPDEVTLSYAAVGAFNGNMTVTGPVTAAKKSPYSLRVYWDTPTMQAGDHWYSAFDIGTDAGNPGNIGLIPVYIDRVDDDVTKSVIDVMDGVSAVTVTYAITVAPNITPEDLTYWLTDTIPAGMTYLPGSAGNGTTYSNGQIFWSSTQFSPNARRYLVSDSFSDASCTMPMANSGNYLDLLAFGFTTNPVITGTGNWWRATYDGGNYAFFDDPMGTDLYFTDEGYVSLDINSVVNRHAHQSIPSADLPNANMAILWRQMNIVYDAATNAGVTSNVRLRTNGVPSAKLIEFDNIQMPGDPTSMADFEVLIREAINDDAGAYEIIYAYDNLTGDFTTLTTGTIGVENRDGTMGTQYAYDDAPLGTLQNGMAVCFDWAKSSGAPQLITYQVTVDDPDTCNVDFTNTVTHTVDNIGSLEATIDNIYHFPCPDVDLVKTVGTASGVCATSDSITLDPGSDRKAEVTYCYSAENIGLSPLYTHTLVDSELGALLSDMAYPLMPGATYIYTANVTLTGTTVNTATWTATTDGANVVTDTATAMVTFEYNHPDVAISVSNIDSIQVSDAQMTQTFTISNAGSGALDWDLTEDGGMYDTRAAASAVAGMDTSGLSNSNSAPASKPNSASPRAISALLYDQMDNPGSDNFLSQFFPDAGGGAYGADDFTVPITDSAWTIETIEIAGSYRTNGGYQPQFGVDIYADDGGGLPGQLLYSASDITPTQDLTGSVTIDLLSPASLAAGDYWISVWADMAWGSPNQQWYWSTRVITSGNPYSWEDRDGLFNHAACPTWGYGASDCGIGVNPDSLFRLSGYVGAPTCTIVNDIPWVSASPISGTVAAGGVAPVDVTFDSTGLAIGVYTSTLCINTNVPAQPIVNVPLSLDVVAQTYTLTMKTVGNGTTTPVSGTHVYTDGDSVTLSQMPDAGWQFDGWSGSVISGTASLPLIMDSDKAITATFTEIPTHTLSVVTVGQGLVGLDSTEGVTGTGNLYQTVFISGTVVTATAYPANNWSFSAWSGAATGTSNPASFVMNMSKVLTATFTELGTDFYIYLPVVMKH